MAPVIIRKETRTYRFETKDTNRVHVVDFMCGQIVQAWILTQAQASKKMDELMAVGFVRRSY